MGRCDMAHVEIDVETTIHEMVDMDIPPHMRRRVLEGMEWMDNLYENKGERSCAR